MDLSRRLLLEGLSAAGLVPTGSRSLSLRPDTILHNGALWTGAKDLPQAQAIAIRGERIVAVGANDDILAMSGPDIRRVDLGGARVTPGFFDAHAHPVESGVQLLVNVNCETASLDTLKQRLRQRAGQTPPGQWVRGFLYDDAKTERPVTRTDLDEVSTTHPIVVGHRGGHTAFVNSLALRLAGIGEGSADPQGGRYFRGVDGRLNGRLGDAATGEVDHLAAYVPTRDDLRKGAALISRVFSAKGVTSAGEAEGSPQDLQGYLDAHQEGTLNTRIYCNIFVDHFEAMAAAGVHTGLGDDWVRIGAQKQFADGSISERTAWLSSPYLDMKDDFSGLQTTPPDELFEKARRAHLAGWQLGIHANGDLAIDRVLKIFERLQKEAPRPDPRFRIEHCTLVNADLIRRMKAVGAIPIPFAGYIYFHGDVMHFYGEARTRRMFAMRSFLDAGIAAPSASDYTASPSDPMMWLQSQLTRTDPQGHVWGAEQKITLEEALVCGTLNGARAAFQENDKGTLEPGKLADLVVWGKDPFTTAPSELISVPVQRTMTGGRWVYES